MLSIAASMRTSLALNGADPQVSVAFEEVASWEHLGRSHWTVKASTSRWRIEVPGKLRAFTRSTRRLYSLLCEASKPRPMPLRSDDDEASSAMHAAAISMACGCPVMPAWPRPRAEKSE